MKKILIVGNKGFIGNHVFRFYSNSSEIETWGCDVVTDHAAVNYIQIDETSSNFELAFAVHEFDLCINCSGAASVPDSFRYPAKDFLLNVVNVHRILESIRKYQPRCKFLNLSSAAVYGNPAKLPVVEEDPVMPLSPYGWHKCYAEQICREYFLNFQLRTSSARIFSAFGPGLQKQIFWDWHRKIQDSSSIVIYGTGSESRDFIFVEDVVQAISCISDRGNFSGEIINVGNGQEIRIAEAAEIFRRVYFKDFTYSFSKEIRKGDPVNWVGDIDKLKALGYRPSYSLQDGLELYCRWLKRVEL